MSRVSLLPLLLLGMAPAACGCRSWTFDALRHTALLPAAVEEGVSDALGVEIWRLNTDWSPRQERDTRRGDRPDPGGLRWGFDVRAADHHTPTAGAAEPDRPPVEETADATAPPTGTAESAALPWNGLAPRGLDDLLTAWQREVSAQGPTEAGEGQRFSLLARLARRDGLVGWNAAILLAQRDPASAAEFAPLLERLVAEPPLYRPRDRADAASPDETPSPDESDTTEGLAAWHRWMSGAGEPAEAPADDGRPISPAMRCAAAEAWCLVLSHHAGDPAAALAPAGRLLERPDLPLDVRCELYRGIARRVPPARIPGLDLAFDSGTDGSPSAPVEARRAAMDACLIHALWNPSHGFTETGGWQGQSGSEARARALQPAGNRAFAKPQTRPPDDASRWPAVLRARLRNPELLREPDAQVRRTLSQWLIAAGHPSAAHVLSAQIHDPDPRVRDEAIVSLGLLGTDEARSELQRLARRSEDLVRTAAVRGLSPWGVTALAPLAGDDSFLVRRTVAEELARQPSVEAALLLRDLVTDRHPEVQLAAVESTGRWPAALSVPLLLHGLRDGTFKTRAACLRRLQESSGRPITFPINASRDERAAAVLGLARERNLPTGFLEEITRSGIAMVRRPDPTQAAAIESDLRLVTDPQTPPESAEYHDALDRLRALGSTHVPLIERFVQQTATPAAAVLRRDLLPRLSPAHAALRALESDDVFTRRHGAQELAALGERESLSRLVVQTMAEHMVHEQDALVWRFVLAAVLRDGTDESARIASYAAQNAFADIRRLACEFAARHRRPQDAGWLLPLLSDPDPAVRLAAVRAAGVCPDRRLIDGRLGGEEPLPGLRRLLTDADPQVRLAAAVGMSRLGDSAGIDELIRLSYATDPAVRERVIREMGTTGQTRFVGHLVRLAWTEQDASVKSALLDSLDLLVPPENRPSGLANLSAPDAKIRTWMQWWQERGTGDQG